MTLEPLSDAPAAPAESSDLAALVSEAINPATRELSRLPTLEALRLINAEDQKVALAVREVLPQVAAAIERIAPQLEAGGRLIYLGAGTSGRLGVVDASECPPTFGVPFEMVQGLIAGGPSAVFRSREGFEDIHAGGEADLKAIDFGARDCLIGLAASGRTPYVLGALEYARRLGAFTAGISVVPNAEMKEWCEVFIAPLVGPEAVAGSSRLKAGTAQKMILNMISTGVMLKLGRVEGNLMSHLKPSCEKLVQRQKRVAAELETRNLSRQAEALSQE